jgi:hypothetical protein
MKEGGTILTRIALPPLPTILCRPVGGHYTTLDANFGCKYTIKNRNKKENIIILYRCGNLIGIILNTYNTI